MKIRSTYRTGGTWLVGTTGWKLGLYIMARTRERDGVLNDSSASHEPSPRTMLAIDSASSSKELSEIYGTGNEPIKMPQADGFILPEHRVHELGRECLNYPNTRPYGEKLLQMPDASTGAGVGGMPLVSYVVGMAAMYQLDEMIEARIKAQQDKLGIDADYEKGKAMARESRPLQIIGGNLGGGTFPGLALYLASRIQTLSKKHGLNPEICLLGTTPSALSGGDPETAKANYAALIRQIMVAMQNPSKIVFHTLGGHSLRHTEPLVHRVIPFGPSNGKSIVGSRDEVVAQMALAAWTLLESPYGIHADGIFRDQEKLADDLHYGVRMFTRMGVSLMRLDRTRNQAMAMAQASQAASAMFLDDPNS